MIEAFRLLNEAFGYSLGGCPPKFSWNEEKAKVWTRRGDLVRHLKMLERRGLKEVLGRLLVERIIIEPRAKGRADEFLREFEKQRELRENEKELRRKAREAAGLTSTNINKYVQNLRNERTKDPLQKALDALLKTIE